MSINIEHYPGFLKSEARQPEADPPLAENTKSETNTKFKTSEILNNSLFWYLNLRF